MSPREKKKLNNDILEVRINCIIERELIDWLDQMEKEGFFGSRTHGIKRCIIEAKKKFEKEGHL